MIRCSCGSLMYYDDGVLTCNYCNDGPRMINCSDGSLMYYIDGILNSGCSNEM